jgi:hypothetical protein
MEANPDVYYELEENRLKTKRAGFRYGSVYVDPDKINSYEDLLKYKKYRIDSAARSNYFSKNDVNTLKMEFDELDKKILVKNNLPMLYDEPSNSNRLKYDSEYYEFSSDFNEKVEKIKELANTSTLPFLTNKNDYNLSLISLDYINTLTPRNKLDVISFKNMANEVINQKNTSDEFKSLIDKKYENVIKNIDEKYNNFLKTNKTANIKFNPNQDLITAKYKNYIIENKNNEINITDGELIKVGVTRDTIKEIVLNVFGNISQYLLENYVEIITILIVYAIGIGLSHVIKQILLKYGVKSFISLFFSNEKLFSFVKSISIGATTITENLIRDIFSYFLV